MAFVTTLRFTSGDRRVLDNVVTNIKRSAKRKGVELTGPHQKPPEVVSVPMSKRLGIGDDEFPPWTYTVYTRTVRIVGREEFARETAGRELPDGVHVEVDVDRITGAGRS